MIKMLIGLIDKLFGPHGNIPPPPTHAEYTDKYTPNAAEKRWAKRELDASLRRAEELGIFVDLHKQDAK